MSQLNNRVKFALPYLVLSIALYACGGGGGGGGADDSGDSEGGGDNPPPVSGNVNGGLTGRIFMPNGWIIDLPTGKSKRVPGVVWDSYCYERDFNEVGNDFYCTLIDPGMDYGLYVTFSGYPNINGSEYLLTASDCIYGGGYTDSDCLEIRSSETGEITGGRLTRYENINSGAKLSRDGQYYAYTHNEDGASSPTLFVINDRNHQEITSGTLPGSGEVTFDWGPSGEIVFHYDGALYITSPYSLDDSKIFDLRDHPELTSPETNSRGFTATGFSGFRVSPDGTKIAFLLYDGGYPDLILTPKTPWIMNIDGTDLHRLAYVPEKMGQFELFGSLAWSPDGKYILINEGYVKNTTPSYLYAILSDRRNVELNDEGSNGIIRIQTNYRNITQELRYTFNDGGFWWLP
ncbi:MAG: hypothetical protein JAY64_02750 [Candidatus Thiodiazotropha weberae]|nr:hypothetical protein [Candidatus Thiodiazotropha lotti]MCG8010603.1 hypothetical protein [Candidatus Thiodiazotropha lotti]MCW4210063.1 hypothetical protein [Candidatus Thiodiazotropha lotti]MCW4216945.1 hypothetical protein [Candidatus Thiodiazotropha lotti]